MRVVSNQYRDGYIFILEEVVDKNTFNAKSNAKNFNVLQKLPFTRLSKRNQDIELIDTLGAQLDLKLKTPKSNLKLNNKYFVMVNGNTRDIYTLTHSDETSTEYFFYLSSVGGKSDVIINRS